MTNDYKKTLLNYITGNLNKETKNNEPQLREINELNNNIETFIKQYYSELSSRWSIGLTIQRGNYIICFINDYITSGDNYGRWKKTFIVVLDNEYSPIKYIDTYKSGTPFNSMSQFNSIDDGTGNLYLVDTVFNDDFTVERRRLLIINDFTLNNFEVNLLNSFNIPEYNNYTLTIDQLTKNPNEGKYFMIYHYKIGEDSTYADINTGGVLEFVNNVGSENEWNFYPYTGNKNMTWYDVKGVPIWQNDTFDFIVFSDYSVSTRYNGNSIALITLKKYVSDDTKSMVDDTTFNLPDECKNIGQLENIILSETKVLISTYTTFSDVTKTKYVIEYNLNTLDYNIWYSKEDYIDNIITDTEVEMSYDEIKLITINGQFYFLRHYAYYDTQHNSDWSESTTTYIENKLYLYQIFNNNVYSFLLKDLEQQSNTNYKFSTKNIYNLYEFALIFQNYLLVIKEVFNSLNYNGQSYESYNSLLPNSGEIYSNNKIVFARNLYNKTINGKIAVSTVEVPNIYLNDITLDDDRLVGSTNKNLIINNNEVQKNIYETLYLNYINTLNVLDNDTQILYNDIASLINKNINNGTENIYENSKISKVRINKQNSSIIKKINWEAIDDTHKIASVVLFVDNPILTIDFISNDETIIYLTKDISNLEQGKYYKITQKMEVV